MHPTSAHSYKTLVQLTDSHLFADLNGGMSGVNTQDSLKQVIDQVRVEQDTIDLLLCTGDISQDGSPASYIRFAEMVSTLNAPMRWLAGNHDEGVVLQQVCADKDWLHSVYDLEYWRIVVLDSSIPEQVHGFLAEEQLKALDQALATAGSRYVLIAVHHHPLPVGSAWMDKIGLHNAEQLLERIALYDNVRAVLCGHVHQTFDQEANGVRWLGTPSTCIQFAPGSAEFALDEQMPGYRWLHLYDEGQLDTGVSRVLDLNVNRSGD